MPVANELLDTSHRDLVILQSHLGIPSGKKGSGSLKNFELNDLESPGEVEELHGSVSTIRTCLWLLYVLNLVF